MVTHSLGEQLVFELETKRSPGFVHAKANFAAQAAIESRTRLLIFGNRFSGKTEIARAYAKKIDAILVTSEADVHAYLSQGQGRSVIVDDIDDLAIQSPEPVFHLYNLQNQIGAKLVGLATQPLQDWQLTLPDLRSRLATMDQVQIDPPDEELMSGLFVKGFWERGIEVSPKLVNYLVKRLDRDYETLFSAIETLDREAAKLNSKVTTKLARQFFGESHE